MSEVLQSAHSVDSRRDQRPSIRGRHKSGMRALRSSTSLAPPPPPRVGGGFLNKVVSCLTFGDLRNYLLYESKEILAS